MIERLLAELVRAPTLLGAEQPGQAIVRRELGALGLHPRELALQAASLRAHPACAPFAWELAGKANVTAEWGGLGPGRSLILCGHVDVVPPGPADLWSSPPFEPRRQGEWLYGRGAGDMKAGLAAIVGTLGALRALGLQPCGRLAVHSVVEEECTGNGALACVLAGEKADAAIITEPTSLAIQTAQVGVLWFELEITGRPGHAGEAGGGLGAIEAAWPLIGALRALEAELNQDPPPPFAANPHPINLNVGIIDGGDWASTVPARCRLRCRLALYPGMAVSELRGRVEQTVARALASDPALAGLGVRLLYEGFACEGCALDDDEPLVGALAGAIARVAGGPPATLASTATTDARTYLLYGRTPAVCFGPHAECIHAIDERVLLPSVLQTAQALALFIRDWCGLVAEGSPSRQARRQALAGQTAPVTRRLA
jgi:acetylornithine deacetylase